VEVLRCAKSYGIHCGSLRVISNLSSFDDVCDEGQDQKVLTVLPLQSWYHAGFDKEAALTAPEFLDVEEVNHWEF
jgi:hypothetical protein